MAQVHYYRDIDGTLVDMSAYAPRLQWTAASKSEEGAVGSWTVTLDDPLGELDILGHRTWFVEDDESEDDDDIIFGGFTGSQTFARMDGDQRRRVGPAARVITVELYDANTWLSRIVMRGSDCKRPRENDAERMAWLLSTAEAGLLADTSTFVDTSGPRAMDKVDLRGTYLGQIVGDCASASGKNYFVWFRKVSGVRTLTIWYGRDTLPDYPSPFYITNDRTAIDQDAIEDGTADVWELSADAKMLRTPERQYCGNYLTYGDKGAATYRHNSATHAVIASYGSGHRDMTSSLPLVKTKAKAQARADRQLEDVADQDVRITTRLVNIPSTRVTLAKSGMRLQVEGTHWGPTCDDWHYARIVSAQPKPHGRGELYDIDLELVLGDESDGPPAPDYTGDVFAGLQRTSGYSGIGYLPAFAGNYDNHQVAGWQARHTEGPLHIVESSDPYLSIEIEQGMTVKIQASGQGAGVYLPSAANRTLSITVNGVVIATDSRATHVGFDSWTRSVEIGDYHLEAGDVVSVTGTQTDEWGNSGLDSTYLRIGRGTILADFTNVLLMVGP